MGKISQTESPSGGGKTGTVVRLADWSPTRTQTVQNETPSSRSEEVASIRSFMEKARQQQEVANSEKELRQKVSVFHHLALSTIAMYGLDHFGFQVSALADKKTMDTVYNELEKLDAERKVDMVRGEYVYAEKENPSKTTIGQDARLQNYAAMHRKFLTEHPIGNRQIVQLHPILHNLCPSILTNRGLIERLLKIQDNLILNMEQFRVKCFDIRIRGTDPKTYEQEIYNFFRYFDRSPEKSVMSRIGILRESSDEESALTRPEVNTGEIEALDERARIMKAIFKLQGDARQKVAIQIRSTDLRRRVPLSILGIDEKTLDGTIITHQALVMEYLKAEHDISVMSARKILY